MTSRLTRLDKFLVDKTFARSRAEAVDLIEKGFVKVDRIISLNKNKLVGPGVFIEIDRGDTKKFASRGGFKLDGALDDFGLDVTGMICMDVGASTGGFTDALLQRGAAKVHAVDVGSGLLDGTLAQDPRIVVYDKTNFRNFEAPELEGRIDLIVCDASFISIEKFFDKVSLFLREDGIFLPLIKPQFEVGRGSVGKGGIVKDEKAIREVLLRIERMLVSGDFTWYGVKPSRLKGAKGNQEYLALARKGSS